MSKQFFTKLLMSLAWLAAAVLWLLSELKPDTFGFSISTGRLSSSAARAVWLLCSAAWSPKDGRP
ncbi:MAG: hypothetical protein ACLR06_02055 [Christensenellaceae bacterium]